MAEAVKTNVESNDATKVLLNFVNDTKDGKYTENKPELTQIIYKRVEIEDQIQTYPLLENTGLVLFGLSF